MVDLWKARDGSRNGACTVWHEAQSSPSVALWTSSWQVEHCRSRLVNWIASPCPAGKSVSTARWQARHSTVAWPPVKNSGSPR